MGTEIERAARAYVKSLIDLQGADTGTLAAASVARDIRLHDLFIALGEACPWCDPGTCPGSITKIAARHAKKAPTYAGPTRYEKPSSDYL